jgi:hypothetical protein
MEPEDQSFPVVAAKDKETEQVKLEAEDTPVPPEAKSLSVLAAKGNVAETAPLNTAQVVAAKANLTETAPHSVQEQVVATKDNSAETAPRNTVHVVPTKGNLSKTGPFASKAGSTAVAVLGSDPPYAEPQFKDVGMKHGYRKHRYCGCAMM